LGGEPSANDAFPTGIGLAHMIVMYNVNI